MFEITLKIATFISVLIGLYAGARMLWVRKFPFKVDIFEKQHNEISPYEKSDINTIEGINDLFLGFFTMRIQLRSPKLFDEINVKFLKKEGWGPFCRWAYVPKNIIVVRQLTDPKIKEDSTVTYRVMEGKDDGNGGMDGWYKPPLNLPKDGILWLKVKYSIALDEKVDYKLKCYIGFQHRGGSPHRGYGRKKLTFNNKTLPAD